MRTLAALLAAALLVPAVAAARVSTAKIIETPSGLVSCYAALPQSGGGIDCSARYLQRPAGLGDDGDPYIPLRRHGRTKVDVRGDYEGYANVKATKLAYGDTWKRPGIRCTLLSSGLTCHNLDGHGFHLASGDVRFF